MAERRRQQGRVEEGGTVPQLTEMREGERSNVPASFRLPELSRDLSQGSQCLSACCSFWKELQLRIKKGESYMDFEWLMCHGFLVPCLCRSPHGCL